MQKYIITDGKRFLRENLSGKNIICNSAAFAVELSYSKAKKILLSDNTLEGFYMEGVEDFIKVTKDDLLKNQAEIESLSTEKDCDVDLLRVVIDQLVHSVCDIKIPDKRTLISYKDKLLNALSQCDLESADVVHWAAHNKPPAHIRCKVFGYISEHQDMHEKIKEKIRYVEILMDFHDKKFSFNDLVGRLKSAKCKPYKANTAIYAELDALLA